MVDKWNVLDKNIYSVKTTIKMFNIGFYLISSRFDYFWICLAIGYLIATNSQWKVLVNQKTFMKNVEKFTIVFFLRFL